MKRFFKGDEESESPGVRSPQCWLELKTRRRATTAFIGWRMGIGLVLSIARESESPKSPKVRSPQCWLELKRLKPIPIHYPIKANNGIGLVLSIAREPESPKSPGVRSPQCWLELKTRRCTKIITLSWIHGLFIWIN